MRFEARDGAMFGGETAREAAQALRAASRLPEGSLDEFMAATAAAARIQTGQSVRGDSAEALLEDLERAGLIRRID